MTVRAEVARVLLELGPDLSASEWATRLAVSERLVVAIASDLGIALAVRPAVVHGITLRELALMREVERERRIASGLRMALADADG